MPIYKRNNKYYAKVNYKDDNGKYKSVQSKYFDTKREAIEEEAQIKCKLNSMPNKNILFKDCFYEYKQMKLSRGIHTRTLRRYDEYFLSLGNFVNKKIQDIRQSDFDKLNVELKTKYKSTKAPLTLAKAVCKYASSFHYISIANIQVNVYNEKKPKEKLNFLTFDEFTKLYDVCDNKLYKYLFDLLFFNGLRISEARGLTFNDFDGKHITINKQFYKNEGITDKLKTNHSYRTIPVNKRIADEIYELKEYYKTMYGYSDDWYIFGGISPKSCNPIREYLNKSLTKANVHKVRIHDLRHSCASYYIHLGNPINLIAELLGDDINTIYSTYYHLYKNDLDEMINDGFLGKVKEIRG